MDGMITVLDNGKSFNPLDLPDIREGRGGALAVRSLLDGYAHSISIRYEIIDDRNVSTIVLIDKRTAASDLGPCYIQLKEGDTSRTLIIEDGKYDSCPVVYISFTHDHLTPSDLYPLAIALANSPGPDRHYVVFVGRYPTKNAEEILRCYLPRVDVIPSEIPSFIT